MAIKLPPKLPAPYALNDWLALGYDKDPKFTKNHKQLGKVLIALKKNQAADGGGVSGVYRVHRLCHQAHQETSQGARAAGGGAGILPAVFKDPPQMAKGRCQGAGYHHGGRRGKRGRNCRNGKGLFAGRQAGGELHEWIYQARRRGSKTSQGTGHAGQGDQIGRLIRQDRRLDQGASRRGAGQVAGGRLWEMRKLAESTAR